MSASSFARSAASVGGNLDAARVALKNSDTFMDAFKALKADDIGKIFKGIDADDLVKTMKKLSDDDLATIGKTLDQGTINRLAKTTDGQELLAKMGRSQSGFSKLTQQLRFIGNGFTSTVKNLPADAQKAVDGVRSKLKSGSKADAKVADDASKAVKQADPAMAKATDEATEATPAAKDGLKKLGMYATGGTLVLMLVYNTANPFRAIERALNDVGEVASGVKEVADSAAGAIKDVTKGGFDFLSFITKNAWISGSMSLLCLILIFTFIMTSFLGGGNNRGRRLRN